MPRDPLTGQRFLMFVEDIYEDLELWYPKYRLIEAGAKVIVAAPKAGGLYAGKHSYPCVADAAIADMELVVLAAPAPLNLVCFRHQAGDDFNRRLLARLNRSGAVYLSHTVLNGRFTLRLCVGQTNTEARHVTEAWRRIEETARELEKEAS